MADTTSGIEHQVTCSKQCCETHLAAAMLKTDLREKARKRGERSQEVSVSHAGGDQDEASGSGREMKGDLKEGWAGCPREVRLQRMWPTAGEVPGLDKRRMTDMTDENNKV